MVQFICSNFVLESNELFPFPTQLASECSWQSVSVQHKQNYWHPFKLKVLVHNQKKVIVCLTVCAYSGHLFDRAHTGWPWKKLGKVSPCSCSHLYVCWITVKTLSSQKDFQLLQDLKRHAYGDFISHSFLLHVLLFMQTSPAIVTAQYYLANITGNDYSTTTLQTMKICFPWSRMLLGK